MSQKKKRPIQVCNFCRKRKIRCDKKSPCTSCVKFGNKKCDYGLEPNEGSMLTQLTAINSKFINITKTLSAEDSERFLESILQNLEGLEKNLKNGKPDSLSIDFNISNSPFQYKPVSDDQVYYEDSGFGNIDGNKMVVETKSVEPLQEKSRSYSLADYFDDANDGLFKEVFIQSQDRWDDGTGGTEPLSNNLHVPSNNGYKNYSLADYFVDSNQGYFNENYIRFISFTPKAILRNDRIIGHFYTRFYTDSMKVSLFDTSRLPKFTHLDSFVHMHYIEEGITSPDVPRAYSDLYEIHLRAEALLSGFNDINRLLNHFFNYFLPFLPSIDEIQFRVDLMKILKTSGVFVFRVESVDTGNEDNTLILCILLVILKLSSYCEQMESAGDLPMEFIDVAEACLAHFDLSSCSNMLVLQLGVLLLFHQNDAPSYYPPEKSRDLLNALIIMADNMRLSRDPQHKIWHVLHEVNHSLVVNKNFPCNFFACGYVPHTALESTVSEEIYQNLPFLNESFLDIKILLSKIDIFNCEDELLKKFKDTEARLSLWHENHMVNAYNLKCLLVLQTCKLSVMFHLLVIVNVLNKPEYSDMYLGHTIDALRDSIRLISRCNIQSKWFLAHQVIDLVEKIFAITIALFIRVRATEVAINGDKPLFSATCEICFFVCVDFLHQFKFSPKYYKAWKIEIIYKGLFTYIKNQDLTKLGVSQFVGEAYGLRSALKFMQVFMELDNSGFDVFKALEPVGLKEFWTNGKLGNLLGI